MEATKYQFGLIGRNISYSFSQQYFTDKFKSENLPCIYSNFDIQSIEEFEYISKTKNLVGCNVTIPYKQDILSRLTKIDATALEIGAVNTVHFLPDGTTIGYNTDCIGFRDSILPLLNFNIHKKALIFGTGGASLAIVYVLERLGISVQLVSRKKQSNTITYEDLSNEILATHTILINCTPVGTFPNIETCIKIPYEHVSNQHLAFDLIYNPTKTQFLKNCELAGAKIKNGHEMLFGQAEAAWKIWSTTLK